MTHLRPAGSLRWLLVAAVIVLVLGTIGYRWVRSQVAEVLSPAIAVSAGAARGFNVVLITLDTLRADRVGCYGYAAVETPALDALAAEGIRFTDAVTPVPLTLPAHSTILTGSYPPTHGVRNNGTYRLLAEHTTLAECLQARGYATAAFIAAFVLDDRYGTDQGFEVYDDRIDTGQRTPGATREEPQRPGNVVTDSAIRWLEQHSRSTVRRPFFMWLHLFDPHTPYEPPEPFRTRYASDLYAGEVAFADQQVGRVVSRLRELALLDETLLVAVGDHGEGLGDHAETTHGLLIYDSTMRVPLILHAPAVLGRGVVVDDRVVATADLMPTVLDLLGLEPGECDGVSLLRASSSAERAVYVETLAPRLDRGWSPLRGLRRNTDKYIEAPTPEYYDLIGDPGELRNLFAGNTQAGRLREDLAELVRSFPSDDQTAGAKLAPDQETRRKLAALGYVVGDSPVVAGPLLDPKDVIVRWQRQWERVRQAVGQGRHRDAVPLVKQILADTPGDGDMWSMLATTQVRAGLVDDAIESRRRCTELQPDKVYNWIDLARLQLGKGNIQAVVACLERAEQVDPGHGEIYLLRARLALRGRRYQEAVSFCEEARKRDPTRHTAPAWSLQAAVHEASGRLDDARSAYGRALEADSHDPAAQIGLIKLAARDGDYERALELAQQVRSGDEHWPESQRLLALVCLRLGQTERAVEVMREVVRRAPRSAWAHRQLGSILARLNRTAEAVAACRKAVELAPQDAAAHYELANALAAAGDVQASIHHLRAAVSLRPTYRPALEKLAELLESAGEHDEAARIRARIESLPD